MTPLRKLRALAAGLVAMFVFAQFAGVVPRAAVAQPSAAAAALSHHQHDQHYAAHDSHNRLRHHHADDQHGNVADQCCALHLLAGVVPLVITAIPAHLASTALTSGPTDSGAGLGAPPLYRPPRSLSL